MFKYNNTHIFTGYIKQLLHDFNLPKFRIYTKANEDYYIATGKEKNIIATIPKVKDTFDAEKNSLVSEYDANMKYVRYIKDNTIQEYINGKWYNVGDYSVNDSVYVKPNHTQTVKQYNYNSFYPNYTKNLKISSNVYDSYTHEYLGDYLRFLRDYNNINLMPLYNCFSDNLAKNISLSFNVTTSAFVPVTINKEELATKSYEECLDNYYNKANRYLYLNGNYIKASDVFERKVVIDGANSNCNGSILLPNTVYDFEVKKTDIKVTFNTNDTNYKIYAVPVKLFQKYTIAMDSDLPIELCCVVYKDYVDQRNAFIELPAKTYKKFGKLTFSNSVIYDTLETKITELLSPEALSELAINEQNLKLLIKVPRDLKTSITILEGDYTTWNNGTGLVKSNGNTKKMNHSELNVSAADKYRDRHFITKLQLLSMNIGSSIPFADRLVEYLTGNAITDLDDINDDIERVQYTMANTTNENFEFVGLWNPKIRVIAYEYMQKKYTDYLTKVDLLGYIDKETEKAYTYERYDTDNKLVEKWNISGADLYEDRDRIRRKIKYAR